MVARQEKFPAPAAAHGVCLLALVWLSGCASMATVLQAKADGGGTTVAYSVTSDQAYDISMAIFRWEGSDAIEEHKSQGYMLTSWTQTVAGAFVEKIDGDSAKVTVVTQRKSPTRLVTDLTEGTFHNLFAKSVEIVKSGKPLPITRPETSDGAGKPRK